MARAPRTKSIRKLLSSFDAPEPSPSEVATTLKRLVLQREVDGDVDDEEDEGDDDDDEDADDDGLSPSTLLKQSLATREQWFRTQKTRAAYVNYVKSGKAWLADWVQKGLTRQHGKSQKNREPESAGVTTLSSEERSCFVGAFDEISQYTPIALRLLIAYKCDHLTLGFSTAEGIRAAFKEYFLLEKQCEGNVWRFNDQLKQWEGNPVFEIDFATYFESLKHRDERTSTTKRALPMLPDDLRIIMRWLDSQGQVEFGVTRCLYFKAFATTGFCLWTRNNELVGLRGENIKPHQVSSTGIEYHDFILRIRKTNADNTKEQHYWIPFDREHPEIDCFSHMTRWLAHLSDLRGRPVNDDDFIFPVMSRKGHLKYGQAAGGAAIQALLDEVVAKSGVMNGRRGKFTTHCFRRGGAQYRFMFAEDRWSLKVCKWWGAWSSNERVETLVRYLLEELSAYEDNFGDILMPDRRIRRQETFMGMPNSTLQQGPLELRPADVVEATLAAASKEVNQQHESHLARLLLTHNSHFASLMFTSRSHLAGPLLVSESYLTHLLSISDLTSLLFTSHSRLAGPLLATELYLARLLLTSDLHFVMFQLTNHSRLAGPLLATELYLIRLLLTSDSHFVKFPSTRGHSHPTSPIHTSRSHHAGLPTSR
ncbi:hypothetical protein CERSUDRAFT_99044 [Gelatoporia subvermispora B]|uniref:Tyr recombinase domain-containing protein n=1 Tax=Ceriporiopsis subvermispora (strain B) TaxID=914234 RepID=M2Q874_CERS8|nr:hypothetical protein CERSUDRAFT_99044 [Gelatoporia subvermispora B]